MIIVYSFLVFDLPHRGHIEHLAQAKKLGDILVVGILDDITVEGYKRKPVMCFEERMRMAQMVRGVDLVVPQFEKYPLDNLVLLSKLFPDCKLVCVHGNDWKKDGFAAVEEFLKKVGGELRLLPYFRYQSTTKLIEKIRSVDNE